MSDPRGRLGVPKRKEQEMCEDYPCCGHELGDCNGNLYDSDENIKWAAMQDWGN